MLDLSLIGLVDTFASNPSGRSIVLAATSSKFSGVIELLLIFGAFGAAAAGALGAYFF
jgi:hypothetical protein